MPRPPHVLPAALPRCIFPISPRARTCRRLLGLTPPPPPRAGFLNQLVSYDKDALNDGMLTLREYGSKKLAQGETTFEEIIAVTDDMPGY